ncbi:putative nuclease HARBI1 [Prorops nasuta]|uniref:putative nuclease HARBI1 n=1 Tax=Prorops nasuta TaxID=863751 RepID=UPI0034CEA67A
MDLSNMYDILLSDEDDSTDEFLVLNREQHLRINSYYETVVCNYSLSDFKSHFRLSKPTFELLIQKFGPCFLRQANSPKVQPCKQLTVTLWILGNQEVYRSVSDRFGLSKDTIWKCVINVSYVLQNHIKEHIKWPGYYQLMQNANTFAGISNFPGVVGVIDGCHIPISTPVENPNSYVNRKGFHSLVLQGICDYNRKFIDVFVGYCGSVHDARIWQNSHIKTLMDNNSQQYFPRNTHLLGDSAYPLSKFLLTPYKDNGHLSLVKTNYNRKLSATRMIIERTFGLLKCRWRKLKYIYMYNVDMIPLIVSACCVLHNICIDNEEESFDDNVIVVDEENDYDGNIYELDDNTFSTGEEKRDIIANLINT